MAAAAGILFATGQGQLLTISGWKLLIPLFAAVVAGGIGNPYGAFAGAIFVGVVGEVSTAWLEPSYKPAVFFRGDYRVVAGAAQWAVRTEQELAGRG